MNPAAQQPESNPSARSLRQAILDGARLPPRISRSGFSDTLDQLTTVLIESPARPSNTGVTAAEERFQQKVLDFFAKNAALVAADIKDSVFTKFLKAFGLRVSREVDMASRESADSLLALVTVAFRSYVFLKELGVPRCLLAKNIASSYSPLQVQEIIFAAEEKFGPKVLKRSLAKTASYLVLCRKYDSVMDAASAYQDNLRAAERVFGRAPGDRSIARSVAYLVFTRKYPSVASARKCYSTASKEAAETFSGDENSQSLAATAVHLVLTKKYHSIAEAKLKFDQIAQAAATCVSGVASADFARVATYVVFKRQFRSVAEVEGVHAKYCHAALEVLLPRGGASTSGLLELAQRASIRLIRGNAKNIAEAIALDSKGQESRVSPII